MTVHHGSEQTGSLVFSTGLSFLTQSRHNHSISSPIALLWRPGSSHETKITSWAHGAFSTQPASIKLPRDRAMIDYMMVHTSRSTHSFALVSRLGSSCQNISHRLVSLQAAVRALVQPPSTGVPARWSPPAAPPPEASWSAPPRPADARLPHGRRRPARRSALLAAAPASATRGHRAYRLRR